MNLAHLSMSTGEKDKLVIDDLIFGTDDMFLQHHLLTANTNTVASTVQAIEDIWLYVAPIAQPGKRPERE